MSGLRRLRIDRTRPAALPGAAARFLLPLSRKPHPKKSSPIADRDTARGAEREKRARRLFWRGGSEAEINEALEAEYNLPLRHPEHRQVYAQYELDSASVRAITTCELDIAYGSGPGERLDFFPAARRDAPLFLFIHGDYWLPLDKRDFSFLAPAFAQRGIAVALINYHVAPLTPVEAVAAQTQAAIRWVHDNARSLGFNPARLVVGGHSAGAQLAALALAAQPALPIAAAITASGLYDLLPLLRTTLNEQLGLDERRARRLSPVHDTRPLVPPALIAVGAAETHGFVAQAGAYAAKCDGTVRVYPRLNHYSIIGALADPASGLHRDVARVVLSAIS